MLSLMLFSFFLGHQTPAPQPPPMDRNAAHLHFKTKATASETLAKEASKTLGCRVNDEGSATDRIQAQMSGGMVNRSFKAPTVDDNPIMQEEKPPRFYEIGHRASAAAFSMATQDGKVSNILSLKGRVVVVFLFKPDCAYTAEVLNEIIRLQGMQGKKGFVILPVSIGTEGWSGLDRYRKQNSTAIPAKFQIFRLSGKTGEGLSVFPDIKVTPTTYILDREGQIAWRIVGAIRGALTDKLNHILSEPQEAGAPTKEATPK